MATKEELFEAVRLIKEHCRKTPCHFRTYPRLDCPLYDRQYDRCVTDGTAPEEWDSPEGGGEDVE